MKQSLWMLVCYSLVLVFVCACGASSPNRTNTDTSSLIPPTPPAPIPGSLPFSDAQDVSDSFEVVQEEIQNCVGNSGFQSSAQGVQSLRGFLHGGRSIGCSPSLGNELNRLQALNNRGVFPPGSFENWLLNFTRWLFLNRVLFDQRGETKLPEKVLAAVFVSTPEGTHRVGGIACPEGSKPVGSFADCGGATCQGNQLLCLIEMDRQTAIVGNAILVTDFGVTTEGAHIVGGPGCPGNYKVVGSAADCGGGQCNGNQLFCARFTPLKELGSVSSLLTSVRLTDEGAHQVGGPGCPEGFEVRGSLADCGGGVCQGNQLLCVKREKLDASI